MHCRIRDARKGHRASYWTGTGRRRDIEAPLATCRPRPAAGGPLVASACGKSDATKTRTNDRRQARCRPWITNRHRVVDARPCLSRFSGCNPQSITLDLTSTSRQPSRHSLRLSALRWLTARPAVAFAFPAEFLVACREHASSHLFPSVISTLPLLLPPSFCPALVKGPALPLASRYLGLTVGWIGRIVPHLCLPCPVDACPAA